MAATTYGRGKAPKSRRLGFKIAAGVVGAVLVGWLVYATVNILNPSQGDVQARSDAVVSLAPQSRRLPTAQELIGNGVADTLVVSYFDHDSLNFDSGASADDMPLRTYCESEAAYEIVCFTPEENATIGEAYAVAGMAREQSWEALTVVTDTTHVFRARFILDRCLGNDFDVNVVVAERELTASEQVWHVVYENAAFFKAAWQATWRC